MRKTWPFTFYFLFFAGVAFLAPFIVLYYQSLGFTGTQIGLLAGLTPLITLFGTLLWTGLADATRRHRLIMSLALLVGVAALSLFPFLKAFAPVMLITILLNMFFAPVSSFADSATMFMLVDKKEMYGRVRLGGTFGFGLAAPIAGRLVQDYGLKLAFWGGAALMFLAFVVSPKLVYRPSKAGAATGGSVLTLLTNRRWVFFLAVAFAGGLTLAVTNNYLFPYLKELGANETTMGLALAIGTIGEIPVLFFGNQLIQRLKPYGLLMLAMVVSGIRLLLFAASSTPNLVMLLQLFAGLTFPAMWVAGVSYADDNAPAGMGATAQGLFGAMVFGFGMAMGGFLGGLLLANLGGQGMYLVVGVIVLAIVALSWLGERLLAERPAAPHNV
ncbi:MAG: hypothetical protein A2W37_06520 [Chloroflexi bacterium RBG_16_63_12]|nr:MAG: hypothetical protein A2W37_06520 [Chloroflexi bacterium RBG_16_63_12]